MNPNITCSSCRKNKCFTCFENPNNDRIFKTCVSCRMRKSKHKLIIKDKIIEEDIKVEENQDDIIVTKENRNMIIHMIIKYLKKDEAYKIEASKHPNMFCIYLIDRHALISVNNGDTWKHVKRYIDKPRPDINNCSICFENQCVRMISRSKCFVAVCVTCTTNILENNEGQIVCAFCRAVVGFKMSPVMVQMMSQSLRFNSMKPPENLLDGIHA